MTNREYETEFLSIAHAIDGATTPGEPTAAECCDAVMERFPPGKIEPIAWQRVKLHKSFDLRLPEQVGALAAAMQQWCAGGRPIRIRIAPDAHTERIISLPIGSVAAALERLVHLPSGFVIGPPSWEWVADIRMIGSAYLGFAPTSFRRTLIEELAAAISDAALIDPVGTRSDLEDYYTPALLEYPPFAAEFAGPELDALRSFLQQLEQTPSGDTRRMAQLAAGLLKGLGGSVDPGSPGS